MDASVSMDQAAVLQSIADLDAEAALLSQLIYRNHNQHNATELFSHLKSTNRLLKMLTKQRLAVVCAQCDTSLRTSTSSRLSTSDIHDLFSAHTMIVAATNLCAEVLHRCYGGSTCVRICLAKRIFAPLYSMMLAITARLLRCLQSVFLHFHKHASLLLSQLQKLELLQPKHSKTLHVYLQQYPPLSARAIEMTTLLNKDEVDESTGDTEGADKGAPSAVLGVTDSVNNGCDDDDTGAPVGLDVSGGPGDAVREPVPVVTAPVDVEDNVGAAVGASLPMASIQLGGKSIASEISIEISTSTVALKSASLESSKKATLPVAKKSSHLDPKKRPRDKEGTENAAKSKKKRKKSGADSDSSKRKSDEIDDIFGDLFK